MLLKSKLLLFLKEVIFNKPEFCLDILVSNIKYTHPELQNDYLFYPFHHLLDYPLAHYFAKAKTTKSNINKFLTEPLMALLIEKISYQNADKWMKKILKILWGFSKNKWTKQKCDLENDLAKIPGWEISIYSQNMMGCLKFWMRYPAFWHNQKYEHSCIFNESGNRVFNEMHSGKWCWKEQKKHPS